MPERSGAEIRLRLRAPLGHRLLSAETGDGAQLTIDNDCVVLPAGATGTIAIETRWQH